MNVVAEGLRQEVVSLEPRRWLLLGVVLLPVPVTAAFFIVHGILTGASPDDYGAPIAYLIYSVANVVVLSGLYAVLTSEERAVVFRFRTPSPRELGWVAGAFPVGLGIFWVTDRLLTGFGFTMGGLSYSLTTPTTVLVVIIGPIIIAPVTEEIFYRGLVLGKFLSHGMRATTAVAVMAILFGLIHLPNFGVTGTVFTTIWGVLPAILRLRFDNLSGAVLLHMINNIFAYIIVVGLELY